jgi:hypothetical protein
MIGCGTYPKKDGFIALYSEYLNGRAAFSKGRISRLALEAIAKALASAVEADIAELAAAPARAVGPAPHSAAWSGGHPLGASPSIAGGLKARVQERRREDRRQRRSVR